MRRLRIALGLGAAALGTVLIATATFGQGAAGTGIVGPIGGLLPGVRTLGAPDWVQPGTRLTWYAAGASIANADFQWQEDEDGTWEDPVTGRRYSQTDAPTASGEGIFQLDVVAVDGPDVAVQWVLHGLDRSAGRFFSTTTGGGREAGADPEDFWIHPDLLAQVPETDLPDLKILRGPYTVNGTTYQGLGILDPDRNHYSSQIFDLATGTLLSTTSRTQGNASRLHVEGQDPPEANTQLTIGRYLGTRRRDATAMTAPIPTWADPGFSLLYTGTWTFRNPYDPDGQPVSYPARFRVTFAEGGPTWRAWTAAADVEIIRGAPLHTETTGIATGAGPWWIAPEVLATARPGQVLDEDPITGERVSVSAVDPGAGTVTIDTALAGLPSQGTYDLASGALIAITRTEESTGITAELGLHAVE